MNGRVRPLGPAQPRGSTKASMANRKEDGDGLEQQDPKFTL